MTSPAFLIDECLPLDVTLALRQHGFNTTDVVERGLRGSADLAVWELAAAEGRVLVTRDLDFPLRDVLPRPAGLVLLRAENATSMQLASIVAALVESIPPADLIGRITVVSPGRYRQRAW